MSQSVRTMSGDEQQMVAIGRALMSAPTMLLLCKELFNSLVRVRDSGLGVLPVEQNARQSLGIADRAYVMATGRVSGGRRAQ